MNNNRRAELRSIIKKMESLKGELEKVESDEQEYYYGMPENLQGSMNGMNSEEALDKIAESIVCLEDAIESIEGIV